MDGKEEVTTTVVPQEPPVVPQEPTTPQEPPVVPQEPNVPKEAEAKKANGKAKVVVPKETSGSQVEDEIAAFFKNNPNVEMILKAGNQLFLATFRGSAEDCARRLNCEVEEVTNPNI